MPTIKTPKTPAQIEAKANLLTGTAAEQVIADAAWNQEGTDAEMIAAVQKCSMTEGEQTTLREKYIAHKLARWALRNAGVLEPDYASKESAVTHALRVMHGMGATAKGGTKATEGKYKRTSEEDSKYGVFKADWSRLLKNAGVASVNAQPPKKREPKVPGAAKANGKVIAAAPKVDSLGGAWHHLRDFAAMLVTFNGQNKDLPGFGAYSKAIADFVETVNKLPHE